MRCCALPESTGWKLWNTDESKLRKLAECMWATVLERCDDEERARAAVDVIPEKYRIGNTGFTGMALVGDGGPGWNHPHKDRREIFGGCIVTLSGDVRRRQRQGGGPGADRFLLARRGRRRHARGRPRRRAHDGGSVRHVHARGHGVEIRTVRDLVLRQRADPAVV